MRIYTAFTILLMWQSITFASDTTYADTWTKIHNDTIFYNWQVRHYPDSIYGSMGFATPRTNGKIWTSGLMTAYDRNLYVSFDNLQSWKRGILPGDYFNKRAISYSLLEDTQVIFTANTMVEQYTYGDGFLYVTDDITKKNWTEIQPEIFKGKPLGAIRFKDNNNGVVAVLDSLTFRHLYRTNDGGTEWYKLYNISNMLDEDNTNMIRRIEYFPDSHILMCLIYSIKSKSYSLILSNDFGDTWTELRSLPKTRNGKTDFSGYFGFTIINESMWFTGAASTGHGDEHYQFIYFSPDLGKTWEAQYLAIATNLGDIMTKVEFFDNSLVGLACEQGPRVLITFNGGEKWTWIRHKVTNSGVRDFQDPRNKEIDKFTLRKVDNKMIFFGHNRIFFFNDISMPTSVHEASIDKDISVFYNSKSEIIEISMMGDKLIDKITLYDLTGKVLYTSNSYPDKNYFISSDKLNGTKLVFAIIQANDQMYLKKLICE
jgi:photosystem II stability/assembly factor-like uncharacterized protein